MSDVMSPRKVCIMFGSDSDRPVYDVIAKQFESSGVAVDVKVASAHRTPELVEDLVKNGGYDLFITGAGLAAALPGVVAAITLKPVIGVPVKSNYEGLDAVLSIMQIPPGIVVMGVGVDQAEVAGQNALKMLKNYEYVNIVGDGEHKRVKKCQEMLVQFDQPFKISESVDPEALNIKFVELDESTEEHDALVIYVPLSTDDTAHAALNLLKLTTHGLWVGLNRGDNAAIAAIHILNVDGRYETKLADYRENLKVKVHKANKDREEEFANASGEGTPEGEESTEGDTQ